MVYELPKASHLQLSLKAELMSVPDSADESQP